MSPCQCCRWGHFHGRLKMGNFLSANGSANEVRTAVWILSTVLYCTARWETVIMLRNWDLERDFEGVVVVFRSEPHTPLLNWLILTFTFYYSWFVIDATMVERDSWCPWLDGLLPSTTNNSSTPPPCPGRHHPCVFLTHETHRGKLAVYFIWVAQHRSISESANAFVYFSSDRRSELFVISNQKIAKYVPTYQTIFYEKNMKLHSDVYRFL